MAGADPTASLFYGVPPGRDSAGKRRRAITRPESRFWRYVDKNGPTPPHRPELGPCWIWTAYRNEKGYAKIARGPNGTGAMQASRVAWFIEHGAYPPPDLCACHHCDNPACVRASHLFLGTKAQNNADMYAKGRGSDGSAVPRGDRHYAKTEPHRLARGEKHGCAKLSEADVIEIRRLMANGESGPRVARLFGVDHKTVYAIRDRRIWRHLQ